MIAGATGFTSVLPPAIQRALAIDPAPGSTFMDAEHVVILMQENRSFDHSFGNLKGVRGYRDPRAITLANKNPVWHQTNAAGETYAPFRLDIKATMATWMGSLPHSWTNQVDARNEGKYDQWLQAKHSGHKEYAHMPLTMGYYDRRDIPFYYSLADAFTVCDQNFCSSLTGTTPNRLYLWTGTIRDEQHPNVRARVRNGDTDYGAEAAYITFPERLEDRGVDWRIYQNEISLHPGFKGEEDAWLSNFTDNPIEWFSQYHVRFSEAYMPLLPAAIEGLKKEIAELQRKGTDQHQLKEKEAVLTMLEHDLATITPENYEKLSQRSKSLHHRAFTRNHKDPHFHELTRLKYQDGDQSREAQVPKGDVLHQFREDVQGGKLPAVSWLVAPENFSDHPGAPWYGAWYVSEVMDILTKDPAIWKKTIFILCYDENDGYFDHVPPFVAPDPARPETGRVSPGIDTGVEWVTKEQDLLGATAEEARGGPIGLGYRVPLLIASPWSRGGYVNSQVFDHTSILQFLEKFVEQKTGKPLQETNISAWRRAVCGDLSSVFRPYSGEKIPLPVYLQKDPTIESIHKAQFRQLPSAFQKVSAGQAYEPSQERGVRPACALPYELYCDGYAAAGGEHFAITMAAGKKVFGDHAAGSPFSVYSYGRELTVRNYALVAGDQLTDTIPLTEPGQGYDLRVYGPNGFFRAFTGHKNNPALKVVVEYEFGKDQRPTGRLVVRVVNESNESYKIVMTDKTYGEPERGQLLAPNGHTQIVLNATKHVGWYDWSLTVEGVKGFEKRYAGRVETGKESVSDPAMG